MVNGNGQVTDLNEAEEGVWWEQLKCKQGHR